MGKQIISYLEYENASGQIGMIAICADGSAILSTDEAPERVYRNYEQAKQAIERAGYNRI